MLLIGVSVLGLASPAKLAGLLSVQWTMGSKRRCLSSGIISDERREECASEEECTYEVKMVRTSGAVETSGTRGGIHGR